MHLVIVYLEQLVSYLFRQGERVLIADYGYLTVTEDEIKGVSDGVVKVISVLITPIDFHAYFIERVNFLQALEVIDVPNYFQRAIPIVFIVY